MRKKYEISSLQDEVEHIPELMAVNKRGQNIPKTELVYFLKEKIKTWDLKN